MTDWKTEKQKFLNLSREEKRTILRNYETIDQINTWAEYFKEKQPLPKKIDILGGFQIDPSKNKELSKKVSIYRGDITTLEVSK